ncbi:MAG: SURF1 family protein [Hyphomonadaceae bacterium]|nr:SURF1 family protein [Hyphomonadaceae bacterium]
MIRFRPLPIMTAFVVLTLGVLVLLGDWQMRRYQEKVALARAPAPEMTLADYEPVEEGVHFVYGVMNGGPGWRVFAPVREGETLIYVDSGFLPGVEPPAPDAVRFPPSLAHGAPIQGRSVRPGEVSPLAAPPSPADRLWFSVDLPAMARASGFDAVADYYIAADYVGEDGRAIENPFAQGGADPLPPERHLGYALTWWGLALTLLGVYFAYHVNVGRLKVGPPAVHE